MGFNANVMFISDHLYQLEKDPEAGRRITQAIRDFSYETFMPGCRKIGGYGEVLAHNPADYAAVTVTGGNWGFDITDDRYNTKYLSLLAQQQMAEVLRKNGWKCTQPPRKRKVKE